MKGFRILTGIFISLLTSVSVLASPDKIGSGGGVWVCEDGQGQMHGIMFMDIFEARREYRLNVPDRAEDPRYIVQEKKRWMQQNLSQSGERIAIHTEYVEKNITWIDDVINQIPDGANKISPHPSTCRQGRWNPVQLVNFTDDDRVLVRREIFESPLLTNVERAAVYIHEGVYSYLRSEFGDQNSVRTRAIVGFVFSDLSDAEKTARIQKVLGANPNPAPPPQQPPAQGWMCGLKADVFSPLYIFEAATEQAARVGVVEFCKKGENPLPPDFPIPGFPGGGMFPSLPGFPGSPGGEPGSPGSGFPGPGMECKPAKVLCEQITTSEKIYTCELPRPMGREAYEGTGRTQLEARRNVMAVCDSSGGSRCYTSDEITCRQRK